jgi:hypothetical protein
MDYFYASDGFGANGLIDYYLKGRIKAKENLLLSIDAHEFVLPSAVSNANGDELDKKLGTEIDFVFIYNLTKAVTFDGGYSAMFSTDTMAAARVKNVTRASPVSDWAYLMISIKPSEVSFKNYQPR